MESVYDVDSVQRAALYHRFRAAVPFLAELEYQPDVMRGLMRRKILRRGKQHGGVAVVAAGVHAAVRRSERQSGALLYGQPVEIGAQRDGLSVAAGDIGNQSGMSAAESDAEFGQPFGYVLARAELA